MFGQRLSGRFAHPKRDLISWNGLTQAIRERNPRQTSASIDEICVICVLFLDKQRISAS
jgi:hypothetical protein